MNLPSDIDGFDVAIGLVFAGVGYTLAEALLEPFGLWSADSDEQTGTRLLTAAAFGAGSAVYLAEDLEPLPEEVLDGDMTLAEYNQQADIPVRTDT